MAELLTFNYFPRLQRTLIWYMIEFNLFFWFHSKLNAWKVDFDWGIIWYNFEFKWFYSSSNGNEWVIPLESNYLFNFFIQKANTHCNFREIIFRVGIQTLEKNRQGYLIKLALFSIFWVHGKHDAVHELLNNGTWNRKTQIIRYTIYRIQNLVISHYWLNASGIIFCISEKDLHLKNH